jgi:hypothetical protein
MSSIHNQPSDEANNAAIAAQQMFTKAKLPIDREKIQSRRLLDMIEQIEVLPARGARTIWELLLDAGADVDHLHYRDPTDDDCGVFHAALQFRISSAKLTGFLVIEDDPDKRCYRLLVQKDGRVGFEVIPKRIYLKTLADEIYDLVDDGQSRLIDNQVVIAPAILGDGASTAPAVDAESWVF